MVDDIFPCDKCNNGKLNYEDPNVTICSICRNIYCPNCANDELLKCQEVPGDWCEQFVCKHCHQETQCQDCKEVKCKDHESIYGEKICLSCYIDDI